MKNQSSFLRQWRLLNTVAGSSDGVTLEELAKRFEVSEKTIRRDIKTLQSIPFPLERGKDHTGMKKYFFSSFYPTLAFSLTYDELFSLYVGRNLMRPLQGTYFWDSLQEAFRKIKLVLKQNVIEYAERIAPLFYQLDRSSFDYTTKGELIDIVLRAMEENRVISIAYQSAASPRDKTYSIYPYSFVYHHGFIYVVGHSCKDGDIRFWKVNRLKKVRITDEKFQRPKTFNVEQYLSKAFCPFVSEEGVVRATLKFKPSISSYVKEMSWDSFLSMKDLKDGSLVVTTEMEGGKPLLHWLLGFGADVEVLRPASLREALLEKAKQITDKYLKTES
ncbi:MAG: transcriptional regulator [Thermoguttaceae bacterium]|nr:transcriptional regulator [Thermoguttaceae bacterium]